MAHLSGFILYCFPNLLIPVSGTFLKRQDKIRSQHQALMFLKQLLVVLIPISIQHGKNSITRFLQFGDQSQYDRIAFYGLPPVCNLKVFTERGDLIWEKDHTRGTGDELWDSQTSSGQIIASGVYILYVSTPDNRSVIRKFVVIR